MAFEKVVPQWNAPGVEPPSSLKESGFTAGYKPPADYFNWFWHSVSQALTELQTESASNKALVIGGDVDLNDVSAVGLYTWSAGSASTIGNVPEKSQGTMLVLPRLVNDDPSNIIQMVLTRENSVYVRNKYDNAWTSWFKAASESALNDKIANHGRHVPDTCTTMENWNVAVKTGWYMGNNAENSPCNGWLFGFVVAHTSSYVLQEVYAFTNSSTKATDLTKYIRHCYNGAWSEWINVTVQRTVPEAAKLEHIKTLTSDAQTQLNGKMLAKPAFIELSPGSGSSNGGYLDFHFGGSTEDYTTRIIEEAENQLGILADIVRIAGVLLIAGGNAGLYGDASTVNVVSKSDTSKDYKRALQIMNAAYESDISKAAILIDKSASGSKNYKLYGEHNKPTPSAIGAAPAYYYQTGTITAGSASSDPNGSIRLTYE